MKRFTLLLMIFFVISEAHALPLSPVDALSRWMQSSSNKVACLSDKDYELKFTAILENGDPALYVFGTANEKGFAIIAADDASIPLLGYSDSATFDSDNIPPALYEWIESYKGQIKWLSERATDSTSQYLPVNEDWEPIEPLVNSRWNQDEPFNNHAPELQGMHSVTGCVATSMAQVMNFFKYPDVGTGTISYLNSYTFEEINYDFSLLPFDWDNMLDVYNDGEYTDTQAEAVANLMMACGASVKMNYSPIVSGAASRDIAEGLKTYFNYDKATRQIERRYFTYNEWAATIYDNLKNIGPVIYNGIAPLQGGHSFICDGYENGYFHFNWGWGGMADGYFLLDALAPSNIGIGGFSGGFSVDQDAIIGIQPPTGSDVPLPNNEFVQYGSLYGKIDNDTLYLGTKFSSTPGWEFRGSADAAAAFGVIIEDLDDPADKKYVYSSNLSYKEFFPRYYIRHMENVDNTYIQFNTDDLNLNAGKTYRLTLAFKMIGSEDALMAEEEWVPVKTDVGLNNYIEVTATENGYTVDNIPIGTFTISDLRITSDVYYGSPISFEATITNNTDLQLSRNISIVLLNEMGKDMFTSDNTLITLDPGQTLEYSAIAQLYRTENNYKYSTADYQVKLFDVQYLSYYATDEVSVTVNKNPGTPTLSSKIEVVNSSTDGDLRVVMDNFLDTELWVKVEEGFFGYPITYHIGVPTSSSDTYTTVAISAVNMPFIINEGEETVISHIVPLKDVAESDLYLLKAAYQRDNKNEWIDACVRFRLSKSSVVSSEEDDFYVLYEKESKKIEVFSRSNVTEVYAWSINGQRLPIRTDRYPNHAMVDLNGLSASIIILSIQDSEGRIKKIKIAL